MVESVKKYNQNTKLPPLPPRKVRRRRRKSKHNTNKKVNKKVFKETKYLNKSIKFLKNRKKTIVLNAKNVSPFK